MPLPYRKRFPLRHRDAYGRDAANAFFVRRLLRNSFLDELRTGTAGAGMLVMRASVENDSAATVVLGIGPRLVNAKWNAGSWTQATTTFADDTTDAQDAGVGDFALSTLVDNDGHLILSREPFSALLYDISTAAVSGAGHAREWSYWSGTAFTALTAIAETTGGLFTGAGRNEILFEPPADWTRTAATSITGVGADFFVLRYRVTDAPDTAALATTVQVWDPLRLNRSQVLTNTTVDLIDNGHGVFLCSDGEGLCAAVSTADAGNLVNVIGEDVGETGNLGAEDGRVYAGQN